MEHDESTAHLASGSPHSESWLFAQSLLGNSIPSSSAATNRARAEREHLEWLAQISNEHESKLCAVLREEAESREALRRSMRLPETWTSHEQWDPSKHPRQGGPPNAGWFASTGGGGGSSGGAGWSGSNDGPDEDGRRAPPQDMLDLAHAWWQTKDALQQARRDIDNLPGRIANERAQVGSGGRYAYVHTQSLANAERDLETARSLVPQLEKQLSDLHQQYRDSGYDDIDYTKMNPGEHWVGGKGIENVGRAVAKGGSPAGPRPTGDEFDVALAAPAALQFGRAVLRRGLSASAGKAGHSVDDFVGKLPRKPTPSGSAANQYEIKHTGSYNYTVSGGGTKFDIDGYRGSTFLETKHVGNPKTSPYVPGSSCPDKVRAEVLQGTREGLGKIRKIIKSGSTPFRSVEVITNSPESKKLFEGLLKEMQVPGTVRLQP